MDLGLPAKVRPNRPFDNTFEPYRNWNYKKIIVSPNTALQNQKLYVSELKKLQSRNEKKSGIEFIINDNNSYQDFIALMDAMSISKQDAFSVDMEKTGHFFALHFYKDANKIERGYDNICGTESETIYSKEERNYKGFDTLQYLPDLPKQSFYVIFGFLLFVNISMPSIKERFQLHH